MRPLNSTPSSSPSPNELGLWKSPIPYLFGGLAIMLALISVALVILICSYRKRASQSSTSAAGEDLKQAMPKSTEIDTEPKVLVIMAGDDKPTYLAKPASTSSSIYCTCGAEAEPASTSSSTYCTCGAEAEPKSASSSTYCTCGAEAEPTTCSSSSTSELRLTN